MVQDQYFQSIQSNYNKNLYKSVVLQENGGSSSSDSNSISEQCGIELLKLLTNQSQYSFQMGVSSGNAMNDMGNFDYCLDLPKNESQYCLYQSSLSGYIYYLGICIPAVCTENDALNIINLGIQQSTLILPPYGNTDTVVHCYNKDRRSDKEWNKGTSTMVAFCSFFAGLVLVGTALETIIKYIIGSNKRNEESDRTPLLLNSSIEEQHLHNRVLSIEKNVIARIFLSFSLVSNYNSYINSSSTKRYFDSLDGVRSLSMIWVVLGHSLLFLSNFGVDNVEYVVQTAKKFFAFQVIPAGEFAVDIFFTLSGFLVAYSVINQLDKFTGLRSKFGSFKFWSLYVIHRFIRLSPLYFFLIPFFMYIGPQMGTGPAYYLYRSVVFPNCANNWWANLLYINNLVCLMGNECFAWAWYLGNDFQFYLCAPIMIISYRINKKLGWFICCLFLAATFTVTAWVTVKYEIEPSFVFGGNHLVSDSFITDIYQKPWFRIGPYVIGIMMAFLHREEKIKKMYQCRIFRSVIYILSFATTFILSYISYTYYQGSGWSVSGMAFYNATARTLFTVGLCLFVMATFYGHGGVLKWLLELRVWKPISKLTYSTYLVHPIIIMVRVLSTTLLFHYSWTEYAWSFIGNIIYSISAAFAFHLCIEKPFINLEKLIFPSKLN
eukprot:gene3997-4998_t